MRPVWRMGVAAIGMLLLSAGVARAAEPQFRALPLDAYRLKMFEGTWKITGEVTAGQQIGKITGDAKCEEAASGYAVSCKMNLKGVPNVKEYTEVGIFAFDPNARTVHYYSAANTGEAQDQSGGWTSENTLQLRTSTRVAGKPAQEELRIIQKSPNEIDVTNPVISGGQSIALTHFTFKKD